jgi:flagellar biosynthesis/type III secretory pathway chaperone
VETTVAQLEQVIGEERDAIRRLDGRRVLELAQRKQALVAHLCQHRQRISPEVGRRLSLLMPRLKQNGILLAHARNVLRDAVSVMRRATSPTALPMVVPPVGTTLSVRG